MRRLMILLFVTPALLIAQVKNPAITESNVAATICSKKWSTKSIRPSAAYTNKLKRQQLRSLNLKDQNPKHYEEDHIISLELGGHPTDPNNLIPQAYEPRPGAHEKDRVENLLHKEVCNCIITLKRAQEIISYEWQACYAQIAEHKNCK